MQLHYSTASGDAAKHALAKVASIATVGARSLTSKPPDVAELMWPARAQFWYCGIWRPQPADPPIDLERAERPRPGPMPCHTRRKPR
jgi:hypothetical protein